jgi:uncharacterized protein (DUF58 family)
MQSRMPGAGGNLKSLLRGAFDHPVTHGGLVFTAVMLLLAVAAMVSANNLLFLIVAAMLATLMISGFVSRLSLAGLELDFQLPDHIVAHRKQAGRVYVRNNKAWMSSFSVHVSGTEESVLTALYFPVIPGRTIVDEMVEVCFQKRGIYHDNGFRFSTCFPFGFLERRAHVVLRRDVLVYPSLDPQPGFEDMLAVVRGDLETPFRGSGRDFYRIRPYEALESARHVDWKATAHVGSLQVREFAREQERLLEIFLDLNVPPDRQEWFDRAVDACAFLVWRMATRGARVRFRSQEFDVSIPENGDAYRILKYLATVEPLSHARPADGPIDEESCRIVFTACDAERFAEAGWHPARFMGPAGMQ